MRHFSRCVFLEVIFRDSQLAYVLCSNRMTGTANWLLRRDVGGGSTRSMERGTTKGDACVISAHFFFFFNFRTKNWKPRWRSGLKLIGRRYLRLSLQGKAFLPPPPSDFMTPVEHVWRSSHLSKNPIREYLCNPVFPVCLPVLWEWELYWSCSLLTESLKSDVWILNE